MFKKYTSLENTYRGEFLERIKGHGFGSDEYIVQEKAHGANLSYWTKNGEDFYSAKRSSVLTPTEKFYNHELILDKLRPSFKRIWEDLEKELDELNQLTVFGEVIGGNYPHPEVKKDNKSSKVQRGVFYSPTNVFYAFDILINSESYLSVDHANSLFEKHELLHAKTLFRGPLDDCLNYPNDFHSTIPALLDLPELSPNIVEGVVIKPVTPRFLNNGVRVILKNKNDKWSENTKYKKTIRPDEVVSEKVLKLQEAIALYVTENRLNNVLSKIGEVTLKDFGRVLGQFNKDVVEDFVKDYHGVTDGLDKKELKQVTKSFGKKAVRLVKVKLLHN